MSSSRIQDGREVERKKKSEAELQMHDFGQQTSHSSSSPERSSSRPKSSRKSTEGTRKKMLNPYGLTPSTIPPFALDEQLKAQRRQGTQNQGRSSQTAENTYEQPQQQQKPTDRSCKDPFLVYHNDNWDQFVENVGSNVAYLHKAVDAPDASIAGHERAEIAGQTSSTASETDKSSSSEDLRDKKAPAAKAHSQTNEKLPPPFPAAPKNVFADLDGSWGGSERLNAIFNGPLLDSNKFTNNQDRQDWSEYLESVKAFYYCEEPLNPDLEAGLQREGEASNGEGGENNRLQAFLEKQKLDFKQKRKHWRQLERQKKQKWLPTLRKLMLDNQYLPLGFRMFIVILSIIALGLAIRIYQNSSSRVEEIGESIPQQASTVMAISVNSIAVFYLFYISYDEFSGKPLGLRNPFGKLRLILLDLLFIIFSSANLALTFNTLYDGQWVCTTGEYTKEQLPKIDYICRKQRALASFLFVMLFLWVATFSLSILRVVEKMNSGSPR
ncbi:LAME_0B05908g1_1 [Lachancea meyersii CBS 8951]|uniref:LAME_0B05908g1_1 n=1 Tax=Lachancea meyersii CBS 8951 TaxID=1266667 RepID=A0A1G4IW46_9SACH|nr:LAME_0B05908g1_1 [Lachancea meyersii CBS 8951]